ncbi:MAG: DnaD domain-containing protein [Brevefilum sp.]
MTSEASKTFGGFREEQLELVRVPEIFFTQLLPLINSLVQLRLILYLFWYLEQKEGEIRYFLFSDLTADRALMEMTGGKEGLQTALQGLIDLGAILAAQPENEVETHYFINSPQGREAVKAIRNSQWQRNIQSRIAVQMPDERPNIFKLYEQNIGVITPMIAEILKEDEKTYPAEWIEEAIRIAVTRNARNWNYVQAILDRWRKEGRGNEQNRRDDSQDPDSYRESWLGEK